MGYGTDVRVQLRRDNPGVSWGFRLQGGKEYGSPLSVQRVFNGSPSDGQLQRGDVIVAVDNHDVRNLQQNQAQDIIQNTGLVVTLAIERSGSSNYDSYVPPSDNYGYSQFQPAVSKQFPSPTQPQQQQQQQKQQSSGWKPATDYHSPSAYNNQSDHHYGHQSTNNYDRGGSSQDHGGPPQVYRSATATFSPGSGQGQPKQTPSGGVHEFDQWGNLEIPKAQHYGRSSDVGDDENYEQKSVGNIKEMFNKDDEVGTQQATSHIKRNHPRAPMRHANEESSFSTPHFGPTPPKSSLTPSRPGAIQRGAADHYSYVPATRPEHHQTQRTPGLYGYGHEQGGSYTGGSKGKYIGGFVGVNNLIKPEGPIPTAPVKKPPGQKKDFDPSHSSVLRILQEEEERSKNSPRGQARSNDDQAARYEGHGGRQGHGGQGHGGQDHGGHAHGGQRMPKGQQWQQQQQQQQHQTPGPMKHGASLQALLEKDVKQNPQEDPRVQHDPHLAPPCAPAGQAEYRRPGTSYKPAENQAKSSYNMDDYPLHTANTERYDYPSAYPSSDTFRSTATFTSGESNQAPSFSSSKQPSPQSYQSYQPQSTQSFQGYQPQSSRHQGYQSSPYSNYPTSDYMGGIPACDF